MDVAIYSGAALVEGMMHVWGEMDVTGLGRGAGFNPAMGPSRHWKSSAFPIEGEVVGRPLPISPHE